MPPAHGGFTRAVDSQRIWCFYRGIRAGFCDENMPAMSELVENADNALVEQAMTDKNRHVRFRIIFFLIVKPNLSTLWDNVVDEFTLVQRFGHLADCDLITRLLLQRLLLAWQVSDNTVCCSDQIITSRMSSHCQPNIRAAASLPCSKNYSKRTVLT